MFLPDFSLAFFRDLHSNGLTGTIPFELGNLAYLAELRLDRNRFSGPIPGSNDLSSSSSLQ